MNIQIGDKVYFLNSVEGGAVREFHGEGQVLVGDEDGFEVPALIKECVVVRDNGMQVHSSNRLKVQVPVETPSPEKPELKEEKVKGTSEGKRLDVCLIYLPVNPKAFQQYGCGTYFVNDSNYYLFFNYMNRTNNN